MTLWLGFLLLLPVGLGRPSEPPEPPIRFRIRNAGIIVEGTLGGLETAIQFDPLHCEKAHIRASVRVATIRTGIPFRDRHLLNHEYFDADHYPIIRLSSTAIRQIGRGRYVGHFILRIKTTERSVTIPFRLSSAQELSGMFQLNRLDFGLGKKSLVLAETVDVLIRVPLKKGLDRNLYLDLSSNRATRIGSFSL